MAKEQKLVSIAARISDTLKEEMEIYCEKHDISLSQLIRKAVKEYISNN